MSRCWVWSILLGQTLVSKVGCNLNTEWRNTEIFTWKGDVCKTVTSESEDCNSFQLSNQNTVRNVNRFRHA